jgi:cytidine deaminase
MRRHARAAAAARCLHELADLGGTDPLVYCCGPSEVREMRLSALLPAAFGPGSLG